MEESLNISLKTIEIPVNIDGKPHVLVEASADVARQYKNSIVRSTKFEDGKPSGVDGIADAEIELVSGCLFEIVNGKDRKQIHRSILSNWPNKAVKPLYDKVRQISNLVENNPAAEGLQKALLLQGSPVSLEKLKSFVCSLKGSEYAQAKDLFSTEDELSKN